jgi:hypothetical protein
MKLVVGRSLRAALASIVPTWLANVPGFRMLYAFAYCVALLGDCLREIAWQGKSAMFPGLGTTSALPLIAQSRGLIQGPAEPDDVFAARCVRFRDIHAQDGSPEGLATEVQAYFVGFGSLGAGVYPVVRFVDRQGNTTTCNADLTVTKGTATWHWDDVAGWVDGTGFHAPAEVMTYVGDAWILVQDPFAHFTSFTDPAWLAAWNSGDGTIDGANGTQAMVQDLTTIVARGKAAGTYVRGIFFVSNPTTFAPAGNIGNASTNLNGAQTQTRDNASGYWDMMGG